MFSASKASEQWGVSVGLPWLGAGGSLCIGILRKAFGGCCGFGRRCMLLELCVVQDSWVHLLGYL